jgi:hypothetical protein
MAKLAVMVLELEGGFITRGLVTEHLDSLLIDGEGDMHWPTDLVFSQQEAEIKAL